MTSGKQTNRKPLLLSIIILGAVIIAGGLILYFRTSKTGNNNGWPLTNSANSSTVVVTPKPLTLAVEGVTIASRGPGSKSGLDVISAKLQGRFALKNPKPEEVGIMAFWRVPSSSTNWYMATKRVNGQLQPAVLDGVSAAAGNWNFEIGGVEVDKTYQGPVILVLIAYQRSLITSNQKAWLDQNKGDGFVEIPELTAKVDSSAPATFGTGIPGQK